MILIEKLNISLVQFDIFWENPDANRATVEELLSGVKTDVVILPEMFTTGFSMNAKSVAEPVNGHTYKWMKMLSSSLNAVVSGSVIIKEGPFFYNRFLWVKPDGSTAHYDKKHLFRLSDEVDVFTPGKEQVIVDYKGWKFLLLVCYDLRFPVWSRRSGIEYDGAIYTANWPESRDNVWNTLLSARGIENQAYTLGVNRIGKDGLDISYIGNSQVNDYMGYNLSNIANKEGVLQVELCKNKLNEFREKFPVHLDSDHFTL